MRMADMTFPEVAAHLQRSSTLVLPESTCEQHGHHLPLNHDILAAERLADILSEETGALVAPTLPYGVNLPCDRLLAGTATLTPALLRDSVLSITDWWRAQGFTRFVLLSFHGDPFHLQALSDLDDDIFLIEPCEIECADVLTRQSTMRHACEAETSIALYLHPEKVRMDQIRERDVPFEAFAQITV